MNPEKVATMDGLETANLAMLSPSQRQEYYSLGYLVVRELFSPQEV